eukprot:TRINITY_DN2746_c0_g1_i1.p1 TRINITY_DN2746_c0_g1~~TRINITY_DN2746_c0_g1_i1.p1  ORF type:complete len:1231 (-),score=410.96 TRINITY_DN2746_c0_g1_i1:49-3240(-)
MPTLLSKGSHGGANQSGMHSIGRQIIRQTDDYWPGKPILTRDLAQHDQDLFVKMVEIHMWLEDVLNRPLSSDAHDLMELLKDGTVLCELMHKISPEKLSMWNRAPRSPIDRLENAQLFVTACKLLEVSPLFVPSDLVRGRNLPKLVYCLHALVRVAFKLGIGGIPDASRAKTAEEDEEEEDEDDLESKDAEDGSSHEGQPGESEKERQEKQEQEERERLQKEQELAAAIAAAAEAARLAEEKRREEEEAEERQRRAEEERQRLEAEERERERQRREQEELERQRREEEERERLRREEIERERLRKEQEERDERERLKAEEEERLRLLAEEEERQRVRREEEEQRRLVELQQEQERARALEEKLAREADERKKRELIEEAERVAREEALRREREEAERREQEERERLERERRAKEEAEAREKKAREEAIAREKKAREEAEQRERELLEAIERERREREEREQKEREEREQREKEERERREKEESERREREERARQLREKEEEERRQAEEEERRRQEALLAEERERLEQQAQQQPAEHAEQQPQSEAQKAEEELPDHLIEEEEEEEIRVDEIQRVEAEVQSEIAELKKQTAPEGTLLSEADIKKRSKIVEEIIMTERDYLRDLLIISDIFRAPLISQKILTPQQATELFSPVLDEITQLHRQLVSELKDRDSADAVGHAFIRNVEKFVVYGAYCANQSRQMTLVPKFSKEIKGFKFFLEAAQKNPICRGLDFNSFLIKPVQRLTKYPLLLKELLKMTPSLHTDYNSILSAFQKVQEMALIVNERVRQLTANQRVLEIQNNLEGYERQLFEPWRTLIEEALLVRLSSLSAEPKERTFFLFNDLLLWGRYDKKKKHVIYEEDWVLSSVLARPFPQKENAIEVVNMTKQKKFILITNSPAEKATWLAHLDRLVQEQLALEMKKIAIAKQKEKENEQLENSKKKSKETSSKKGPPPKGTPATAFQTNTPTGSLHEKMFVRVFVDASLKTPKRYVSVWVEKSSTGKKFFDDVILQLNRGSSPEEYVSPTSIKIGFGNGKETTLLKEDDNTFEIAKQIAMKSGCVFSLSPV